MGAFQPLHLTVLFLPLLVGLAASIFWVVELVDLLRRQFADSNIKLIWVLVVLLGHFVGAAVYYFVGKRQGTLAGLPGAD